MHGQETMFTLRFRPPSFSTALHEPSLSPSSERRSTTTLDRRVGNDRDLTILPPNLPTLHLFFSLFFSISFPTRPCTTSTPPPPPLPPTLPPRCTESTRQEKGAFERRGVRESHYSISRDENPVVCGGRDGGHEKRENTISLAVREKEREKKSDLSQRHARVVVSTTGGGKTRAEFSIQLSRVTG